MGLNISHEIRLFIPYPENEEMARECTEQGYDYTYTPSNPWYIYYSPGNTNTFPGFCQRVQWDIKNYKESLKVYNPDLVLINTLTNFSPYIAACQLGIPIVTWLHGVLDPVEVSGIIDPGYQRRIDHMLLNLSDGIIYNSSWTKRHWDKRMQHKNICVISNWYIAEDNIYVEPNKTNHFICLNNFSKQKGCHLLVEVANELKRMGKVFQIHMYGTEPIYEIENLHKRIGELELWAYVHLHSRCNTISELYKESTCLLQPSYKESFGNTIIEAMAHGRPVIATDGADPEGIIHNGKNGYRIPKGSVEAFVNSMSEIIEHEEKTKKMGKKGYKDYIKYYNGRKAKKELEKFILSCKQEHKNKNTILKELMALHGLK